MNDAIRASRNMMGQIFTIPSQTISWPVISGARAKPDWDTKNTTELNRARWDMGELLATNTLVFTVNRISPMVHRNVEIKNRYRTREK